MISDKNKIEMTVYYKLKSKETVYYIEQMNSYHFGSIIEGTLLTNEQIRLRVVGRHQSILELVLEA